MSVWNFVQLWRQQSKKWMKRNWEKIYFLINKNVWWRNNLMSVRLIRIHRLSTSRMRHWQFARTLWKRRNQIRTESMKSKTKWSFLHDLQCSLMSCRLDQLPFHTWWNTTVRWNKLHTRTMKNQMTLTIDEECVQTCCEDIQRIRSCEEILKSCILYDQQIQRSSDRKVAW